VCSIAESTSHAIQIHARVCDSAAILFINETTEIFKKTVLSHEALRNHEEDVTHLHEFDAKTVLQQCALSFDASLNQIFVALSNEERLFILSRFFREDSTTIIKLIIDKDIT
jgi:non-ribosomal peptide synthetase component F